MLEALNRRLELVRSVQEDKRDRGAAPIDAGQERELLERLADANRGPLSATAVAAIFNAVLDVMKQQARPEGGPERAAPAPARTELTRVAVLGTGLVGTSVALAAKRAGVERVRGWDVDRAPLQEAAGAQAVEPTESLADAVDGAELVVVAVPVGALVATVQEALQATSDAVVTDIGSTKRALAAVDDPRFVPGHPLAGGATGGPARAAADLFDNAIWFLTPQPTADPAAVALVEQFVEALGARVVRLEAEQHDRLLALTSHLPHALANLEFLPP